MLFAIPSKRYPKVILEGMNVRDLVKCCNAACNLIELDGGPPLKIRLPFRDKKFS